MSVTLARAAGAISTLRPGGYKPSVPDLRLREALARAADLHDQSRRQRQESLALRGTLKKERIRSWALTWQARQCRATLTYRRLIARVRGAVLATDTPTEEAERSLSRRISELEARLSKLVEEREAFFDAFARYLEIERSIARTRSTQ